MVFSVYAGFNETAMLAAFADLKYLVKHNEYSINVTTEMDQFQLAMNQFNYTVESLMLELMEPCTSFIKQCSFLNKVYPCDQLFFIAKGSEGFCCAFNYKLLYNYKAYTKYVAFFLIIGHHNSTNWLILIFYGSKSLSDLYGYHAPGVRIFHIQH